MNTPVIAADLRKQLSQICDAIEINTAHVPHTLTFAGIQVNALADDTYSTPFERQTHDSLTLALRNTLYQRCYAYSLANTSTYAASPQPPTQRSPDSYEADDITPRLSAANQGSARWDHNWTIQTTISDGQYIAVKNNTCRTVWAGDFVCAQGIGQPPVPGSLVNIHQPHEATHWQPGFYHAFSNAHDPHFETTPLVRFYWNVCVEDAALLVSEITGQFNHYQMPFRFKCTNLCSLSERTDTAVLYVSEAHFRLALQLVTDIHQRIEHILSNEVPLFTHALAKGLSFAQDPPGDNSFGMERCLRLAQAILQCLDESTNSSHSLSDRVIAQLQKNGLDLKYPHIAVLTRDVLSTHLEEFVHECQH